ncbi:MAG: hypothetical protein RPU59_15525, partial [Candidatus Sedimenticola sp. (ex Thyasira tokunagai)]
KALALPALRHKRNTQYGWVANPYPTGTFTLQDAPSFAWRANAQNHRKQKAPLLVPRRSAFCCPSVFFLLALIAPELQ